jgi:hypothetical protein
MFQVQWIFIGFRRGFVRLDSLLTPSHRSGPPSHPTSSKALATATHTSTSTLTSSYSFLVFGSWAQSSTRAPFALELGCVRLWTRSATQTALFIYRTLSLVACCVWPLLLYFLLASLVSLLFLLADGRIRVFGFRVWGRHLVLNALYHFGAVGFVRGCTAP